MIIGLLPAALATSNGGADGSNTVKLEISGSERTDTGLKCQANLTGLQSGDTLWAAVFQVDNPGETGLMKQLATFGTEKNPVAVELTNVSDTDLVRLIWLSADCVVRDFKSITRPTEATEPESGVQEVGEEDFDSQVMSLLHPQFLSAAAEMELEEAAESDPYAYKRLIVSSSEKLPDLSKYGDPLVIYNASTGYSIVQFADEDNAKACEAYLLGLDSVRYVEPDVLLKGGPKAHEDLLNSDSSDFLSWGVTQMKADKLAAALAKKSGTSPVVVAVADTGVQMDHPFLKGRLTDNGFDFIENDKDPQDQHSHGTHVSGTIVDCTPGLDIKIMPVRVLGASGGGTAAGIAMGIRYAIKNGANVINLSLGGGHSNYLDDAIQEAVDSGVTVVVAAGNEGDNVMNHCPAHIINAITVGAVDSARKKASFSNYGEAVDVVAPGVAIKSSVLKGEYGQKNGTSMASPHVAAAAAMLKYGYPDKTPAEIQQALKDTAVDLGDTGWDKNYGYGFPNLEKFVDGWPGNTPTKHTYKLYEDGLTWNAAKAKCEEMGGHLMTVTSSEEQKILESLLANGKKNIYWLGGYEVTEGQYAWVTGESFSYTNWYYGEPNNTNGDEDSLTVYRANDFGKWNDLPSGGRTPESDFNSIQNSGYICEWDGEPNPDPDPAPKKHEYLLFETGMTWEQAKAYCESVGGYLMTVTSAEEQAILEGLLKEGGKNSYWLGATRDTSGLLPDSSDGGFRWITNEEFSYTNWASGEPNNFNNEENALMAYSNDANGAGLGLWNDLKQDCYPSDGNETFGLKNFGFVCEWNSAEDKVDPPTSGIYAILYKDGEMVFQNDDKARQKKEVEGIYPVDGAILQDGNPIRIDYADGTSGEEFGVDYADWYADRKKITKVSIVNKIQPVSTALWFHGCENLESITGLEYLDTSKVTNMSHMFSECYELTELDLSTFNTASVTNMSHMFYDCDNLVNLNVESFDTSKVTDMGSMFAGCTALNRVYATGKFVVTAVTNSLKMFNNCKAIEGTYGTKYSKDHIDKEYARLDDNNIPPVAPGYFTDREVVPGKANVFLYDDGEMVFQRKGVADASRKLVASYVIDVLDRPMATDYALWYEHRDKIKVVTFADLIRPFATAQWFSGCVNLTEIRNIENLDTRAVTDMSAMFAECSALKSLDVTKLNTRKVTSMKEMFKDCSSLTALDIGNFDTDKVTDMNAMFQGCSGLTTLAVEKLNTANVTTMANMFRDCAALTALDLASFDTASLTDMNYMFRNCANMKTLNVSKFNTSRVADMKYLFSGCAALTALDLSSFDTGNVKDMQSMFSGCAALAKLDVSKFDTGKVTNMNAMFKGTKALKSLNVSSFNTNGVTDMSAMFAESGLTALDLHTFNTGKVTNMSGMFQSAAALTVLDLTNKETTSWTTAKVTNTENMFRDCSALKTINVKMGTFATDAVTNSDNMFTGSTKLVGGRGTAYDAAHIDKEYARIDFGKRAPGYLTDPNMVVLSFDPNGDTEDPVTGAMEEQLFSKGVADKIEPNAFKREGYDFKGWNTKADGSGKAYADEAEITLTSDLILYAQWDFAFMEKFYAILYSDGELVFQWNDTPASNKDVVKVYVTDRQGYGENRDDQDNYRAWHNEADQIKTVTFAKRIQPDDVAQWFEDCVNLTTFRNLEKLDTRLVVDMSRMFAGCASLTKLDLHTFDTSRVGLPLNGEALDGNFKAMFENCSNLTAVDLSSFDTANALSMKDMFNGCENLTTIYASKKFVTEQVTDDGRNMFTDCWKLVGGSGTKYDEEHTDIAYAHIDGGTSNPGYFTDKDIGSLMP